MGFMRLHRLTYPLVWLSRIHRCWGFGIQSPTDYAFVREVINEHGLYYAYETLTGDDWLTRKLGRLYLRLANWRRPSAMPPDRYQRYWQAGSRQTRFIAQLEPVELARIDIEDRQQLERLLPLCDERSVIVVEGIHRRWDLWQAIVQDSRTDTTFDLYYCGIVFFDKQRYHHHYKINF